VSSEVDGGPILDQAVVRIDETDTLESLESKIHAAEHSLLPAVIARLSLSPRGT
jgi:phosphoribosylglycinamide formyltransferase-1